MERVEPVIGTSPVSYRAQSKVDKNLRVIDSLQPAYRIDGDWVRLPREIMDALECEGVCDRYVKAQEYIIDHSLLGDAEALCLIYEV